MCHLSFAGLVMAGELALRHETHPAQHAMRLVACGLGPHQRAYVTDGLGRRAEFRFIESYEKLDAALSTLGRCDAFVLAAEDHNGRSALPTVQRIATDWPESALVIFCPPRLDRLLSPRSLALAGAHEFVFEGVNDTAATLARALDNARRECVADSVLSRLVPLIPPVLHSMVHAVLARPDTVTSVEQLADELGVHRKTLVNRCARAGFRPPAEVIVWCRLAMVAHQLERTGDTVESIAMTFGFTSHTSLRNLIKRYTGQRATDIRREGGVTVVLAALSRRLGTAAGELPIQ